MALSQNETDEKTSASSKDLDPLTKHEEPLDEEAQSAQTPFPSSRVDVDTQVESPETRSEKEIENELKLIQEEWQKKHEGKNDGFATKMMAQLARTMETGELDKSDKHLLNMFYRSHKPGTEAHAKLKACRTWIEKRNYTKEWCATEFKEQEKSKVFSKSFRRVDKNKGEYMCFGMLVESFGIHYGREQAVQKATMHATKCSKMQGDWLNYDQMSETMEYLKIKKMYNEIMEEKWAMFTKEYGEEQSPQDDNGPEGQAAPKAKGGAPKNNAKATGKGKADQGEDKGNAAGGSTQTGGRNKRNAKEANLDGGAPENAKFKKTMQEGNELENSDHEFAFACQGNIGHDRGRKEWLGMGQK